MSTIPPGYVRVTELLTPYSGLNNIDPIVLAKAADRGKRAHNYCELHAQSLLIDDIDDDCNGFLDSFKQWFDDHVDYVVSLEKRVYEHSMRITGQYDMIVKFKGAIDHVLVDIKTPVSANRTWAIQTAAYYYMINKNQPEPLVTRRGCLMIDRNGTKAKFKEYVAHDHDVQIFLGIARAYRYFNPISL